MKDEKEKQEEWKKGRKNFGFRMADFGFERIVGSKVEEKEDWKKGRIKAGRMEGGIDFGCRIADLKIEQHG